MLLPFWEQRKVWCYVRVIAKKTLREAWTRFRDAEGALRAWNQEAETAMWSGPEDIRRRYPSASIVGDERVVFNIKGNKYRLVVSIKYSAHLVFIKFFGTHAEYDKVDVTEVEP